MSQLSPTDTFHSRLRHWSVTSPDTPAFIFVSETQQRQVFTRRGFYSLALRTSSWLRSKGVREGNVVALCCPVCPEHLLMMAGATLLGAVSLSLATLLQDGEDIVRELLLSEATVLLVDPGQALAMRAIAQHVQGVTSDADGTISCDKLPSLKHLVHCRRRPADGQPSFLTIIRDQNEAEPSPCDPDDVITYFSTSGSTGWVKLVPRSHREVLTLGQQLITAMDLQEGDIVYNSGSVAWVSGYIADYLVGGFTRVSDYLQDSTPDDFTKLAWQVLVQEQPTAAFVKPRVLRRLTDRRAELQQSTGGTWKTRVIATGGYPVTRSAGVAAALGTLTAELRVVYGTTEAGASLVKVWTDPSQVEDFNCGTALPKQEVKLVDEDDRVVEEAGTRGLLMVRNDVIFKGYLQLEDRRTESVTNDGWYRTGDTAWRDGEGDYFVEGRSEDLVIVLGMKVPANLLEYMLHSHPAVEEVAVVGVPDPDSVSRPCPCVIRKRNTSSAGTLSTGGQNCAEVSEEELLEVYKENFHRGFAASEEEIRLSIPKRCLFFDEFPYSWNGKLQRKELRAIVLERLGLSA